jgi:hypothetical protein
MGAVLGLGLDRVLSNKPSAARLQQTAGWIQSPPGKLIIHHFGVVGGTQELKSSFWSGCGTAPAVQITFGTSVSGDLADISINGYFRLLIWLFEGLLFASVAGFQFMFHASSPISQSRRLRSQSLARFYSSVFPTLIEQLAGSS